MSAGATPQHPLKLRVRLAVLVGALVAAVAGLTAWTCLVLAERAFERRFEAELDARAGEIESQIESQKLDVLARLESTREFLLEVDTSLLEALLQSDEHDVLDAAGDLAIRYALGVLEILDADATIVSSAQWPQRTGTRDEQALEVPERIAVWSSVQTAGDPKIALLSRATVRVGTRRLEIVAGRPVDADWLGNLVGGGASAVLRPENGPVLSTTDGEPFETGGADTRTVTLRDGDGAAVARIDVAVDRTSLERLLARLRWAVLVLVAIGGTIGAAAGAWIARRATRPIEETLRALDDVAAGEADYSFPQATRDGLEALPEAFSRLHRSLDEQSRRRAAAERVAAWREAARRIAHEVKNPLAPIRLTVENLVKARRQAPEMFDEMFSDGSRAILEEVAQLERLVNEFSRFARLPAPKPVPIDLDELLDSILVLYAGEPGLSVDRRRARDLPPVAADPDLLARAFKNLVANAVEAMGSDGGRLVVETAVENGMVVTRIADSGPGFDADVEPHLFEPYFTTKAGGTGLGMALAYRIVTEHGGEISASNRPTGGAEVVVRLSPGTRETRR